MDNTVEKHWITRPASIRILWLILIVTLALTVVAEKFIHPHPHFEVEKQFGFYALYGFFTCIGMIVFAKALGLIIKRRDTYYDVADDAVQGDGESAIGSGAHHE